MKLREVICRHTMLPPEIGKGSFSGKQAHLKASMSRSTFWASP